MYFLKIQSLFVRVNIWFFIENDDQYATMNSQQFSNDQNGYHQELFIDDSKDLHYASQHGGHSTEFSATSSHGSGSGGGGSNQGQSGYDITYCNFKFML